MSTLKQTVFSKIPIIAFLKGKKKPHKQISVLTDKGKQRLANTDALSLDLSSRYLYAWSYIYFLTNHISDRKCNTIDIKKNLRSLHLAFWNPFSHLLQFPKKGLQTSLLWQWSLHRNWQFRPYSPGLHAKNYTKNNWSKCIRIGDFICKMTHNAISFNNKTSFFISFNRICITSKND